MQRPWPGSHTQGLRVSGPDVGGVLDCARQLSEPRSYHRERGGTGPRSRGLQWGVHAEPGSAQRVVAGEGNIGPCGRLLSFHAYLRGKHRWYKGRFAARK